MYAAWWKAPCQSRSLARKYLSRRLAIFSSTRASTPSQHITLPVIVYHHPSSIIHPPPIIHHLHCQDLPAMGLFKQESTPPNYLYVAFYGNPAIAEWTQMSKDITTTLPPHPTMSLIRRTLDDTVPQPQVTNQAEGWTLVTSSLSVTDLHTRPIWGPVQQFYLQHRNHEASESWSTVVEDVSDIKTKGGLQALVCVARIPGNISASVTDILAEDRRVTTQEEWMDQTLRAVKDVLPLPIGLYAGWRSRLRWSSIRERLRKLAGSGVIFHYTSIRSPTVHGLC